MAIGAAAILGSFSAKLGLNTDDYARGIINAEAFNRVFGSSFSTFVSNPLLGSIDLLKKVGGAFLGYSQEVLGSAEAVQRLAQVTGASVETIQSLEQRLDLAGHGADRARQALIKLAQNASNGHKAFEELRIDLTRVGSTDQLLEQTVEAIAQLRRESDRTAIAMALFGEEAGPALINAIGGGADALRDMKLEAIDLGLVMDNKVVNTLADFNTTLGFGKQAIEGLKLTVVSNFLAGFAEEFNTGTGSVREMSAELNQSLGPAAREVGKAVKDVIGDLDQVIEQLRTILGLVEPAARYTQAVIWTAGAANTGLQVRSQQLQGQPVSGYYGIGEVGESVLSTLD